MRELFSTDFSCLLCDNDGKLKSDHQLIIIYIIYYHSIIIIHVQMFYVPEVSNLLN